MSVKTFPSLGPMRWWRSRRGVVCLTTRGLPHIKNEYPAHSCRQPRTETHSPTTASPATVPGSPPHSWNISHCQGPTLSGSKGTLPFSNLWLLPWLFYPLDFLGPRPGAMRFQGPMNMAESLSKKTMIGSHTHKEHCKTQIHRCLHKCSQSAALSPFR